MDQNKLSPTIISEAFNTQFELVETKNLLKKYQSISSSNKEYRQINHLALYSRNDFIVMSSRTEIISIITMSSMLPPVVDIANCFRYPLRHELIKLIADSKESNCIALFNTDSGCAIEIIPLTNIIHRSHKDLTIHFESKLIDIERISNDEYIILDNKHFLHLIKDWTPLMTYSKKATLIKVNYALNILICIDYNDANTLTMYKDMREQCYSKSLNAIIKKKIGICLIETFLSYVCIIMNDSSIIFCMINDEATALVEDNIATHKIHKIKEHKDAFCVFNDKEMTLYIFDRNCSFCELFSLKKLKGEKDSMLSIIKSANVDLCSGIIGAAVNNNVYVNKDQVRYILLVLTDNGNLIQYNNTLNQVPLRKSSELIDKTTQDHNLIIDNNSIDDIDEDNHFSHSTDLKSIDSIVNKNSDILQKIFNDIQSKISMSSDQYIQNASFINIHSMMIKESLIEMASLMNQLNNIKQSIQRTVQSHSLINSLAIEPLLPSSKLKCVYHQMLTKLTTINQNLQLAFESMESDANYNQDICSINKTAGRLYNRMQMLTKFNINEVQEQVCSIQNEIFVLYMKNYEEKFKKLIAIFNNSLSAKCDLLRKEYDRLKEKELKPNKNSTVEMPREINRTEPLIGEMILRNLKVKKTIVDKTRCLELIDVLNPKLNKDKCIKETITQQREMCVQLKKWLDIEDRVKLIQNGLKEEEKEALKAIKDQIVNRELEKRKKKLRKQNEASVKLPSENDIKHQINEKSIIENIEKNKGKDKGIEINKEITTVTQFKEDKSCIVEKMKLETIIEENSNNNNTINDNTPLDQGQGDIKKYISIQTDSHVNLIMSKPQSLISSHYNNKLNQLPHQNNKINHQQEMQNEIENNTLVFNQSFGTNQAISTRKDDFPIRNESFLERSMSPSTEFPLLDVKVSPIPKVSYSKK